MFSVIETWRTIESGFEDGPLNMAIDEMLLNMSIRSEIPYPILRFFGFRPGSATFGISQPYEGSKKLSALRESGVSLTRRPTGGGIVVHENDICYSLVARTTARPEFGDVETAYEAIHQAVFSGFRHLGIDLEFADKGRQTEVLDSMCSTETVKGDLLYQGRKLAGAAERRHSGFFLHQGFISLKPFLNVRNDYFNLFEKVRRAVQTGFSDRFGSSLTIGGLFIDEANESVDLKNMKYATEEWNFKMRPKPVLS